MQSIIPTHTLAEVLAGGGYSLDPVESHTVQPLCFVRGSQSEAIVEDAAAVLRDIVSAGKRVVPFDAKHPDSFWSIRAETVMVVPSLVEALDETTASIALAIFRAAGFFSSQLRATTHAAQAAIKEFVIKAANQLRLLLAQQQSFDLDGSAA